MPFIPNELWPGPYASRGRLLATSPAAVARPVSVIVSTAVLRIPWRYQAFLTWAGLRGAVPIVGVEIFELRLPAQANVAFIVRDRRGFVPGPATALRAGDRLLIVVTATARDQTERRLGAVSRAGKLAGWLGEDGR